MFFNLELLIRQKEGRGPLPLCWLAATLSEERFRSCVSRAELNRIEVIEVCQLIQEHVIHSNAKERISLRLSSFLASGATKIFAYQVADLERNCEKSLRSMGDGNMPPPPVPPQRKKSDKKKENKELLEEEHKIKLPKHWDETFDYTKWHETYDNEIGRQSSMDHLQESLNGRRDKHLLTEPELTTTHDDLIDFEDQADQQTEKVHENSENVELRFNENNIPPIIPEDPDPVFPGNDLLDSEIVVTPTKRRTKSVHFETPSKKRKTQPETFSEHISQNATFPSPLKSRLGAETLSEEPAVADAPPDTNITELEEEYCLAPVDVPQKRKTPKPKRKIDKTVKPVKRDITCFTVKSKKKVNLNNLDTFELEDPSAIQDFFKSHMNFLLNASREFLTMEESHNIRLDDLDPDQGRKMSTAHSSDAEKRYSRITEPHFQPSTPKQTTRSSEQLGTTYDDENIFENSEHHQPNAEPDLEIPNVDDFAVPEVPRTPATSKKPIVKSVVNVTPGRDMRIPRKDLVRAVEEVEQQVGSSDESFMAGVPRAKRFESSESETPEVTSRPSVQLYEYQNCIPEDAFLEEIKLLWMKHSYVTFDKIVTEGGVNKTPMEVTEVFMHCLSLHRDDQIHLEQDVPYQGHIYIHQPIEFEERI